MRSFPLAALLAGALLLAPAVVTADHAVPPEVHGALGWLRAQQGADGSVGPEDASAWAAVAFARAGIDPGTVQVPGGASLEDYVVATTRPYNGEDASLLALERQVLALAASGADPRAAPGFDTVASLLGAHRFGQLGSVELVNDDIFGLLALHAAGVPSTHAAVQDARAFVLQNQLPTGAFSFGAIVPPGDNTVFGALFADVDTTGAAIVALTATGSAPDSPEVLRAVAWMKANQNLDGGCGWSPIDIVFDALTPQQLLASNADSTSWAIMGLRAAGQDPEGLLWSAGDDNLVTFLLSLQEPSGRFVYQPGAPGHSPVSTTAYAALALAGHSFVG